MEINLSVEIMMIDRIRGQLSGYNYQLVCDSCKGFGIVRKMVRDYAGGDGDNGLPSI